jgi:predicted amidohydrolase YtcJ
MADADAVRRMAGLGMVASVQPRFDAFWGGPKGMYEERLGPARVAGTNPWAAMLRGGVRLALGSDSPVTPFDPWASVRAAVRHHDPDQRLDVAAAVAAHTVGGWAASREDGGGVLGVGRPATLAVWTGTDAVPGVLPDVTGDGPLPTCRLTIRDGVVIHRAR